VICRDCDRRGGGDIGQLADVAARWCSKSEDVEIVICLDTTEPPAGRVRLVAKQDLLYCEEGVGFAGWLGLLRVLDELIGSPGERPPEGG
jgi:hypothetical protein